MIKTIELPNSFDGVEGYDVRSYSEDQDFSLRVDYWFHDDVIDINRAYRLDFHLYRYVSLEKDYYQLDALSERLSKTNVLEISEQPFQTMTIESSGDAGERNRELKYYRLFIRGFAYLEIGAKDFQLQEVNFEEKWGNS